MGIAMVQNPEGIYKAGLFAARKILGESKFKRLSSFLTEGGWERDDPSDRPVISQCVPVSGSLVASPSAIDLKREVPAGTRGAMSPPKRKLFHLICAHHESHRLSVREASCS